jgi:hypothetical protein
VFHVFAITCTFKALLPPGAHLPSIVCTFRIRNTSSAALFILFFWRAFRVFHIFIITAHLSQSHLVLKEQLQEEKVVITWCCCWALLCDRKSEWPLAMPLLLLSLQDLRIRIQEQLECLRSKLREQIAESEPGGGESSIGIGSA